MSKHTAGPWYVVDDLTVRSRQFGNSDQMGDYRGCIIADLKPALGATDSDDLDRCRTHARPETDANAHLIAAAPDLLKACRAVVERWETGDLAEAARMCSAAIAKATE